MGQLFDLLKDVTRREREPLAPPPEIVINIIREGDPAAKVAPGDPVIWITPHGGWRRTPGPQETLRGGRGTCRACGCCRGSGRASHGGRGMDDHLSLNPQALLAEIEADGLVVRPGNFMQPPATIAATGDP